MQYFFISAQVLLFVLLLVTRCVYEQYNENYVNIRVQTSTVEARQKKELEGIRNVEFDLSFNFQKPLFMLKN